jgi:hypothetical protein
MPKVSQLEEKALSFWAKQVDKGTVSAVNKSKRRLLL